MLFFGNRLFNYGADTACLWYTLFLFIFLSYKHSLMFQASSWFIVQGQFNQLAYYCTLKDAISARNTNLCKFPRSRCTLAIMSRTHVTYVKETQIPFLLKQGSQSIVYFQKPVNCQCHQPLQLYHLILRQLEHQEHVADALSAWLA